MKQSINIIAAVARNRAIGFENKLIYWLPNDLKRFKQLTTGHTIVMGRRTFESLPKGALPNRRNVVLSRGVKDVNDERYPGCDCYPTLRKALESCQPEEEVYIIGGSSVYQQALPLATRLCLTEVDDIPAEADAFFPPYEDSWQEVWREEHDTDERHAHRYAFVDYVKKEDSAEEATPQEASTPQA
jgi:dihydrofolate reductase